MDPSRLKDTGHRRTSNRWRCHRSRSRPHRRYLGSALGRHQQRGHARHSPRKGNRFSFYYFDYSVSQVVNHVIPKQYLDSDTVYHIQPSGRFVIGGPQSDAGLTGRKIIVDTYGGWGAHGGGAFSGKDYTKVDRSAAYAARWVAKSLVTAALARRCLVQVSYAIGVAKPLSLHVETYGSGRISGNIQFIPNQSLTHFSDSLIKKVIEDNFDLRPGIIVKSLKLDQPIYSKTAAFGHFGRKGFTWEEPKELVLGQDVQDALKACPGN